MIFGVVGYISCLVIENPSIKVWVIILVAALICAFLSLQYFQLRSDVDGQFSVKNFAFGFLPYLVLLPGVVLLFSSIRIQLSYHGPFHMGYIFQIIHGFSPPENVVLPGYAANVYWIYHALLAVLVDIFNTTPLKMSVFINISALIAALYWIRKSLGLLTLGSIGPFFKSSYNLMILLGINLFYSVHITSKFVLSDNLSLQDLARDILHTQLIGGGR